MCHVALSCFFCRIMRTVQYLLHISHNPLCALYDDMWFFCPVRCWERLKAEANLLSYTVRVFLILLIPDCVSCNNNMIQYVRPSLSWSHTTTTTGHSASATAVALVKAVHGRRLIGSQQIRYLSVTTWLDIEVLGIPDVLAIRWDMPALWQLACVCCCYDNTVMVCGQTPEDAAMAELQPHL